MFEFVGEYFRECVDDLRFVAQTTARKRERWPLPIMRFVAWWAFWFLAMPVMLIVAGVVCSWSYIQERFTINYEADR